MQDFCLLLNADQPQWLLGMTEMTRTLCLELMEEVLSNFNSVFIKVSTYVLRYLFLTFCVNLIVLNEKSVCSRVLVTYESYNPLSLIIC